MSHQISEEDDDAVDVVCSNDDCPCKDEDVDDNNFAAVVTHQFSIFQSCASNDSN